MPASRSVARRTGTASGLAAGLAALVLLVAGCGGTPARPAAGSPGPSAPAGAGSVGTPSHPYPAQGPDDLTIATTGDLLVHQAVADRAHVLGAASGQAYDFRPMLTRVAPYLAGVDLAMCHLETPLSADDTHISGYPVFNTPNELAQAVHTAGWQSCSTGSNHAFDAGARGVTATLDALDRNGVTHAGTARTAAEAATPASATVKGARVAMLDYTFGLNAGIHLPAGQPWWVATIDAPRVLADAHAARTAGASVVVVQLHWGKEYSAEVTPQQRTLAATLLASPDVDLVVGQHVHVVQPVERINGKYVVYGTGNFLSHQGPPNTAVQTEDGVIVTAHFHRTGGTWHPSGVTFTPTWCDLTSFVVYPVTATLADPATPAALRPTLRASFARTTAAVQALGAAAGDVRPDATPAAG